MSSEPSLQLNDRVLESFSVAKVFRDHSKKVNSMDFTVDGKYLVSASDDDSVCIYDCEAGERTKMLYSKKYGVDNIKFVHSGNYSAICSSRNEFDFSLRYWDLYENKFIRFFKGHLGRVTDLDVHPYEDLLLSSSIDKSALLWDLRKEKPIARIATRTSPASAFDNQGLVFAIAAGDQKVHLFDSRNFDKGEFTYFDVSRCCADPTAQISKIDFSPCGKYILVVSSTGRAFSIDSFKGLLVGSYSLPTIGDARPTFSPDSQYVLSGTVSGQLAICRSTGETDDIGKTCPVVSRLEGHSALPHSVLFNPVRCMLASACVSVALWSGFSVSIVRYCPSDSTLFMKGGNSESLIDDQNQELVQFVNNILKDMQSRLNSMADVIVTRIDDMGDRLNELEKSVNELLENVGEQNVNPKVK